MYPGAEKADADLTARSEEGADAANGSEDFADAASASSRGAPREEAAAVCEEGADAPTTAPSRAIAGLSIEDASDKLAQWGADEESRSPEEAAEAQAAAVRHSSPRPVQRTRWKEGVDIRTP